MDFHVSTPTGDRKIQIILPQSGNICILASGGIDSSVLLSTILMARQAESPNLPFTVLNIKRGLGTEEFSRAMVNKLEDHFGVEIPFQYVDLDPSVHHSECLTNPIVPLLDRGDYTHCFNAETSNPAGFVHVGAPNRTPVKNQFKFKKWRMPFLHCDKTHIVQLMHQLNLSFIETMSHTCFAQARYRCKTCFQCEERAWAYKTLNLTDPGEH